MIVLCPARGFIYIPLSKVANTSILTEIARATGHPSLQGLENKMIVELDWHRLSPEELYESDLFKFAFVRDPWDRIVSCYHDKIFRWRSSCPESPHFKVPTNWSFGEFLEWAFSREPAEEYHNDPHFIPQHLVLCRGDRLVVDFVGRFERLAEDWRSISLRFGLGKLPSKNMRPHRHYSSYFDGKTRSIVDRFYKRDIELFGYRFRER